MYRLTVRSRRAGAPLVFVEGRLTAEAADELRALLPARDDAAPAELELAGLTALDPEGRACLIELRRRGHPLRGASLYVKSLLEEEAP